jgi:antitoxin MazE
MKSKAQKWGNSLAIRVPSAFAREIGLSRGAGVELRLKCGKLVISPLREKRRSLHSLMARMRKSNQHSETDWGDPAGREVW